MTEAELEARVKWFQFRCDWYSQRAALYNQTTYQPIEESTMVRIKMAHRFEGGTGVTNFQENYRPVYVEAVRRYGDPELVVAATSFGRHPEYGGSLHCFSKAFDLSDFWEVFAQVKKEYESKPTKDTTMNLKPFDLEACKAGKKVVTRDGKEFKFGAIHEGAEPTYRVIGWLNGTAAGFHPSGKFSVDPSNTHAYDLFMAPTKVVKWVNLYHPHRVITGGRLYDTEQRARSVGEQKAGFIKAVKIEWEE